MSDDKALTLAAQAIAAHQEYIKSSKGSLEHAIKAGEFLILAKETVKADKSGRWLDWLDKHVPDIHERTARVYMELAENKAAIKNRQRAADNLASEGKLTIRSALNLVPRQKTPEQIERAAKAAATRAATKAEEERAQAEAEKAKHFRSAEAILEVIDVDELVSAVKHVRHKWDEERIGKLVGLLEEYLKSLAKDQTDQADSKAEDPLAIPPQFARPQIERRA
jgi:Protein of unknown function (DUF3102)